MPKVRKGGRRLGQAGARRRGRVRRVDARRPAARAVVPGAARGQAGARGAPRGAAPGRRSARASGCSKLSNLDKVFWPDEGITKGDLLAYYRAVAPVLLPHVRDRPFTMKRYPDGIDGGFFFQKDAPKHMPEWIPTRSVRGLDPRVAAPPRDDPGAARQRRARAPLDGEHGLHRPEHVVLAGRQARAAGLRPLRPRPGRRRRLPGGDRGRAARQAGARRARPRRLPEDERKRRDARARPGRAPAHVRARRASSRRSSRARSPARTAGSSRPSGRRRSVAAS